MGIECCEKLAEPVDCCLVAAVRSDVVQAVIWYQRQKDSYIALYAHAVS